MDLIESECNMFITGSAGTGKSYLTREIITHLEKLHVEVAIAAPTGIAALNIEGSTIYKLLGLHLFEGTVDSLTQRMIKAKNGSLLKYWCSIDTLIIDEISMMNTGTFIRASQVVKRVRQYGQASDMKVAGIKGTRSLDTPWGGIRLILVGDFLQLSPVKTYVDDDKVSYLYLNQHPIWKDLNLRVINLTEPKRYITSGNQADMSFFLALQDLRMGIFSQRVQDLLTECSRKPPRTLTIKPTILIATNNEVNSYNEDQLAKLPGKEYTYRCTYKSKSPTCPITKDDMIKALLIVDPLKLKVGAQVMHLINTDDGLCNGSRGVVVGFTEDNLHLPIVEFMDNSVHTIGYHTASKSTKVLDASGTSKAYYAYMEYIPLRLAWALTIHKTQSASLDSVYISLSSCFSPGQIYVAMSRCRNAENTYIKDWTMEAFLKCKPHKYQIEFYRDL